MSVGESVDDGLVSLFRGSPGVIVRTSAVGLWEPSVDSHPARIHLHVPLGPDHVVLVGGHRDPGPGTESGVTGPQGSVGEQRRYQHGRRHAGGGGSLPHFSSPVSCFSRSLRGVCPPELQTGRQPASATVQEVTQRG